MKNNNFKNMLPWQVYCNLANIFSTMSDIEHDFLLLIKKSPCLFWAVCSGYISKACYYQNGIDCEKPLTNIIKQTEINIHNHGIN